MAKIRFALTCNIIAAVCCIIVGLGSMQKGETAVGWLFLGLFVLQIVMIVCWIKKIKRLKSGQ